jgi:uncharacterized protein YqeY
MNDTLDRVTRLKRELREALRAGDKAAAKTVRAQLAQLTARETAVRAPEETA